MWWYVQWNGIGGPCRRENVSHFQWTLIIWVMCSLIFTVKLAITWDVDFRNKICYWYQILDVSAALVDQQTIKCWKDNIPSSLRNTLKTYMNEKHPVMPLGVSGLRIPQCIIDAKHLADLDDISESPDTTEQDESSDSPWGSRRAPPGLQESVCHKLKALNFDSGTGSCNGANKDAGTGARIVSEVLKSQEGHPEEDFKEEDRDLEEEGSISSADLLSCDNTEGWECDLSEVLKGYDTPEVLKDKSSKKEPLLNLTVEIISKYQCKPNSMFSFICAREFRRDELAGHFKHFHTEIHTQLNGWLFQRCPMSNQGCSFGIHRLFPTDHNHRIVFSKALSAFSFTSIKPAIAQIVAAGIVLYFNSNHTVISM